MPSDSPSPASLATDNRLVDLEIKVSFMEDLLDDLHAIVIQQRDQMDRLTAVVAELRQQQDQPQSSGGSALQRAIDNLPPHY